MKFNDTNKPESERSVERTMSNGKYFFDVLTCNSVFVLFFKLN